MNEKYNFREIEQRWQKYWEENQCFKTTEDEAKEKYGTCEKLFYRRRSSKIQKNGRL